MRSPLYLCAWCVLGASSVVGCRLLNDEAVVQGCSPLQPVQASPESIKMEFIWARFPAGDPALNNDAWQDIDETQIEPGVHRALADNGLRAGIVKGKLPEPIARALNQDDSPPEETSPVEATQNHLLEPDPIVHGRIQQVRRNERVEIQASETFASISLLSRSERELSGRIYEQAQAIYALRIEPQPDHTARIELTPELHYGPIKMRWTGGDSGAFHQAPLRDREIFDRLRLSVNLGPGDMLVLMSLPDAGSRLGHYFHTVDSADGPQQKLILIRLAEVPPGHAFASR
jgi:hypothetical protein